MESGEVMFQIHDESLVLQFYKTMHQSPSDSKSCIKVEEVNPVKKAPPNKSSKKKSKEDKGKSIAFEDTPTTPHIPYPSVLVGNNNNASSKDVSNHFFDPP
ncbi:hypothetical protein PIB30_069831 [Stylosanthes scabra]|uniref:Uncharacterized protein n=1 Tax=Stylosanthes scabra TaxID=79078 RepID=A0ABU6YKX3_9FABA|nr:hypothetical protein [Stylosanthes scabra]